jgi:hypothetical protein
VISCRSFFPLCCFCVLKSLLPTATCCIVLPLHLCYDIMASHCVSY